MKRNRPRAFERWQNASTWVAQWSGKLSRVTIGTTVSPLMRDDDLLLHGRQAREDWHALEDLHGQVDQFGHEHPS